MNKKQLIVAWVMGIAICFVVLSAPKYVLVPSGRGYLRAPSARYKLAPFINWVAQQSILILLIGGLLIYTLRDRKR